MLRAHSSLTGCKKGAGRREGHCRHHRQCACAAKGAEKLSVPRNLLLLFGRLLLERRGASADLQGEVGFCRSTTGFFTSCSSTRITTSHERRGAAVDTSSTRAALQLRLWCAGPRAQNFAYISRAALLHASHTQAMQPCAPPAPPRIILSTSHLFRTRTSAVAPWAAACTHHHHRSHTARRPFGRRWSSWTFVIPSRRDLDAEAIIFCSAICFCCRICREPCASRLGRE